MGIFSHFCNVLLQIKALKTLKFIYTCKKLQKMKTTGWGRWSDPGMNNKKDIVKDRVEKQAI